jgi:NAD(P)-dependent dehydrogenase (short-subunit alcohol dehydrogenase family)
MKKKLVSVLTGGGGDFGRAVALVLGIKTPVLLLGDFRNTELEAVAKEVRSTGIEVHTMFMDVKDKASCEAFAKKASDLGDVRNVVNIAGVSPNTSYTDDPYSSPELTFSTNSLGTVYMTEAFLPVIVEGGALIHFASMASYVPKATDELTAICDNFAQEDFVKNFVSLVPDGDESLRSGYAYSLSKYFVRYYVQRNVRRFSEKGIRVNSISPGMHDTKQVHDMAPTQVAELTKNIPTVQRLGRPMEMAGVVSFLCSEAAGYISGVDILADGGYIANNKIPQL